MRSSTGDDVSPHGLWQSTLMANSYRDPYFRAQLERESRGSEELQELCLRCHAPMAHHDRVLAGQPAPRLHDLESNKLASDGVSCTVCHQITSEGLGTESTLSGQPVLGKERKIFGPFAHPVEAPMRNMVGYTPVEASHVRTSALCGTCHTLTTAHHGALFPEQTPYFEWRNSEFSDETGATETSRTCQQCHMPETGRTRIARNPMGREFLIPVRDGYRAHAFVGGNAFMLRLLADNREELGVEASSEALQRTAASTKRQLGEDTASIEVEGLQREGATLSFSVRVQNRCGHKFPSGYPSRRAWLHVQVRSAGAVVFESGAFTDDGRLRDIADEHGLPHVTLVQSPQDVPVYELIAADPEGNPTTSLARMSQRQKDTRLLPRGYRHDGPHAEATIPVGIGSDIDFTAGGDAVGSRIDLPESAHGTLQVVAWLHYQTVPPHWVDALRGETGEHAARFVRLYDAADKTPETIAVVTATVGGN